MFFLYFASHLSHIDHAMALLPTMGENLHIFQMMLNNAVVAKTNKDQSAQF